MLIDYPNPDIFFQNGPSSTTHLKTGKSKRKLDDIRLDIWSIYREQRDAEIDGVVRKIDYSYIGFELSGAIEHKNVSEGFTDFEAIVGLVSGVQTLLRYQEEYFGWKYFVSNYTGEEWCKVTVAEMFNYLVPQDD